MRYLWGCVTVTSSIVLKRVETPESVQMQVQSNHSEDIEVPKLLHDDADAGGQQLSFYRI